MKLKHLLKMGTIALYGITSVLGLASMLLDNKREEIIIKEEVNKKFEEKFGNEESDDENEEES